MILVCIQEKSGSFFRKVTVENFNNLFCFFSAILSGQLGDRLSSNTIDSREVLGLSLSNSNQWQRERFLLGCNMADDFLEFQPGNISMFFNSQLV